MVEDKIIIHDKKINYILLIIGFALILLNITISLGYQFINIIGVSIFQSDITSDFLDFYNNFSSVILLFRWLLNLTGIIIFFIAGRKILVDEKFSILVFVLLMVSSFIYLVGSFAGSLSSSNWFIVISFLLKLSVLVFMILILVRNKIMSKLLLVSVILFGINILVQIITPYVSNIVLRLVSSSISDFDIGQVIVILNGVNLISSYIGFAAMVLVSIYLIKSFVKNNVFRKSSLNKLIAILLMIVPTLIVNTVIYVIYLVGLFVLTTI